MTKFLAVEGGDGVGKNTISKLLVAELKSLGFSARQVDFPQYSATLAGHALGEFLGGRFKGVSTTTAAALYALDRFESLQMHGWASCGEDYVIFDRYIASNVAYQSAKVPEEQRRKLQDWIIDLECRVYGLPQPDVSVLLRLPHSKARELIEKKDLRSYTERKFDIHEENHSLQDELRAVYDDLATRSVLGSWISTDVSEHNVLKTPDAIVQEVLDSFLARK
jgi:dTMP kinase